MKDDFLAHYGTPRHSGRYPWGSGKKPQRSRDFLSRYDDLKSKGFTEAQIAEGLGLRSTTELRNLKTNAIEEGRAYRDHMVRKLKDKGMSNVAIGQRLGINESVVRRVLDPKYAPKQTTLTMAKDLLKKEVGTDGLIDVGKGVEKNLGMSDNTLKSAIAGLKQEGYSVVNLQVKQAFGKGYTTVQVLAPPGTTYKDVSSNMEKVRLPYSYMVENGTQVNKLHPPVNISSDRIQVRYAEDGGTQKDGVIELRRGVPELDMGNSKYAQVRVAVDGTHYLKGMAVYNDDMPDGVDIIFNSNKAKGTPKEKVFKKQKAEPDNPFGSTIDRQNDYVDADGNKHEGALNIVREEGAWGQWKKSLAAQMLSKQSPELAKKQLGLASAQKDEEFEELLTITNPTVKKNALIDFADECDRSAVDLKAAALPRQASRVILPITSLKENEIFAPDLENGEEVALIRYPHGGIFEIPKLRVNNKNQEAKSVIGTDAKDAVGIHFKAAEQLSGADFDGDTVLVIPTKNIKLKNMAPLEQLKDFDPKAAYPEREGMKYLGKSNGGVSKGIEMGKISNLITDMTIQMGDNLNTEELARAVRHSMVVIDAEKHKLDYKQSYIDNGIAELVKKYQPKDEEGQGGTSTLLSRAKHKEPIRKRSDQYGIDPITGEKVYRDAKDTEYQVAIKDDKGNVIATETRTKHQKVYSMSVVKDAHELSSGTEMESIYADYANYMKALGNRARLESTKIVEPAKNKSAEKVYSKEVDSLKSKLDLAEANAPRERQAQILQNVLYAQREQDNPFMDDDEKKKAKNQCLRIARERTGAKGYNIQFSDKEWEAIQAGAVSKTMLDSLIKKSDKDRVMELALPHQKVTMSPAKVALAEAMLSSGHTIKEVADRLGVSTSLVTDSIK